MRLIPGSSRTPIGIDVGGRQIEAAQLRQTRKGWRIEALCAIPRMKPETGIDSEEARHLQSILHRQGFSGRDVVLVVPFDNLLTGVLELPRRGSGAPLDQIACMEMSSIHKIPPDSFEMSYWDLPAGAQSKDSTQVMAVGYGHEEANELLDVFEDAGMNVKALEAHTCAVVRACRPMLAQEPGITAVLDIGWTSVRLLIICQGMVAYERVLDESGMKSLVDTACRKLRMEPESVERCLATIGFGGHEESEELNRHSFDEFIKVLSERFDALVEELQTSFRYVARQYSSAEVVRLLLIGGCATIPGLVEHLSVPTQMEAMTVAPADLVDCLPPISAKSGNAALTLAIGLAQFFNEG